MAETSEQTVSMTAPSARLPWRMRFHAWWNGYELTVRPRNSSLDEGHGVRSESGEAPGEEGAEDDGPVLKGESLTSESWPPERIDVAQWIWGEGFVSPGSAIHILDLVKPLQGSSVEGSKGVRPHNAIHNQPAACLKVSDRTIQGLIEDVSLGQPGLEVPGSGQPPAEQVDTFSGSTLLQFRRFRHHGPAPCRYQFLVFGPGLPEPPIAGRSGKQVSERLADPVPAQCFSEDRRQILFRSFYVPLRVYSLRIKPSRKQVKSVHQERVG